MVKLQKCSGLFRFFYELLEADVAAAFAAEGVDVVDPMKERGRVEALAVPLRLLLGPLLRLSGISAFLRVS